ncbi:MAG: SRPBCC family protein [Gemmatimonadota bacterium]|nr:SRPBCC family protein [Gemmatimonadota bacterium]
MSTHWTVEHAVVTTADRSTAWAHWTDLRHHAELEPGIERIELDGPFATGTRGRTIGRDFEQQWELRDVVPEERFVITGTAPGFSLSFAWTFEDDDGGRRMTQRISAEGPGLDAIRHELRGMEENAPSAMARLAERLDRL